MNERELHDILARGEDSRHQFKRDVTNGDSLAAELAAFANSGGGQLFLGVNDDGSIAGLDAADVRRLNQLLGNVASQQVRPPVHPVTENVQTDQGIVIVVEVPNGLAKPYMDNLGRIWVKQGSDKRHVTSREEMQRMFQNAGLVYADELPVPGVTLANLDMEAFDQYYEQRYGGKIDELDIDLRTLMNNLGLARGQEINLAGLLLFGKTPQQFKPAFLTKAIVYPGPEIDASRFLDNEDIDGNLASMYQKMLAFVQRNLRRVQGEQGINQPGTLEIPQIVLEELLVNALVHRDYFISAPVRLFIFSDRIELISPGHLPNHLTPEQVRSGLSNMRNPRLASHASHILPYRGLGTGIPRAIKAHPAIDIEDDRAGNQFKVIIWRREAD